MSQHVAISHGLPERYRKAAAELYFEAFRQKLGPILGHATGVDLLQRTFNDDRVILALAGKDLAGLAGLHYAGRGFVGIRFGDLRRAYGLLRASWRYLWLMLLDRTERPGELLMDGIVVHPDHRGQGIGTRLLARVVDFAGGSGYRSVRLDVVDTNPGARRLYEREGFVATETVRVPWLRGVMGFGASITMSKLVTRVTPAAECTEHGAQHGETR